MQSTEIQVYLTKFRYVIKSNKLNTRIIPNEQIMKLVRSHRRFKGGKIVARSGRWTVILFSGKKESRREEETTFTRGKRNGPMCGVVSWLVQHILLKRAATSKSVDFGGQFHFGHGADKFARNVKGRGPNYLLRDCERGWSRWTWSHHFGPSNGSALQVWKSFRLTSVGFRWSTGENHPDVAHVTTSWLNLISFKFISIDAPYGRYVRSFDDIRPPEGGSEAMHNPISAHLLVRHIALGWPQLKRALDTLYDNVDALGNAGHLAANSTTQWSKH